jgi:histidine ammonia-lyase
MPTLFQYGTETLSISIALSIANGSCKGVLSASAIERIKKGEQEVQQIVKEGKTVYGINTGFGILANTAISKEDTVTLQHKILQSHSVGVGDAIPVEVCN